RLSNGTMKPGERLPREREREFADQLGGNVAGVRKGYHFLRAIGVVETTSGSETFVTKTHPNLVLEALIFLAPLQSFNHRESWVALRLLEVTVVGLAAQNASDDDLALIAEEVTEMYASLDDRPQYLRHDIRFHQALGAAAKNPLLATLTDMVSAML